MIRTRSPISGRRARTPLRRSISPPAGSLLPRQWNQKRDFILALLVALWSSFLGCQGIPARPAGEEGPMIGEDRIVEALLRREKALRGLSGVAHLKLTTAEGTYRGREVFSAELPDRLCIESFNFLGLADFVLCSDGIRFGLLLPSENKIVQGRSDPQHLAQITGAKISPSQMLRILMAHAPFPLEGGASPRLSGGKDGSFLVESEGPAPQRQRLMIDRKRGTIREGEILDERGVWLWFRYAAYEEVEGFPIPSSLDLELKRDSVRGQLRFSEIKINPSFAAEAFRLSPASMEGLSIIDLGAQ